MGCWVRATWKMSIRPMHGQRRTVYEVLSQWKADASKEIGKHCWNTESNIYSSLLLLILSLSLLLPSSFYLYLSFPLSPSPSISVLNDSLRFFRLDSTIVWRPPEAAIFNFLAILQAHERWCGNRTPPADVTAKRGRMLPSVSTSATRFICSLLGRGEMVKTSSPLMISHSDLVEKVRRSKQVKEMLWWDVFFFFFFFGEKRESDEESPLGKNISSACKGNILP